jgi:hypothetical protein
VVSMSGRSSLVKGSPSPGGMGRKPERPGCSIGVARDRCEPGSPVPIPSRALDVEEAVVRIYFHLKSAHEILLDGEGVEVSDPQEARVQAARLIEELRPQEAQYWSGWTLTATDAAGRVLFAVDLDSNVGSGLVSLLFLQGSELHKHLAHMLPDVFAGVALLV